MNKLADKANRAAAALAEAVALRQEVAEGLADHITDAPPDTRHALLRLRKELDAAAPELTVAASRTHVIASNLDYLAGKQ